jgi:hypothetical protein
VMKELDIKAASLQIDSRCSTSLRVFDNGSVPTEAETFVHLYKVRCFGNRILFHRKCIPCLQTLRAKSHSGKHSDHNKLIIQMRLDNHAHDHSSNMLESGSLEKGGDKPSVAVVHDIGMTPRGNTASVESTGPSFSDANAEVEGRSSSKYAAYVSDEGKISVHLRQDKHVTCLFVRNHRDRCPSIWRHLRLCPWTWSPLAVKCNLPSLWFYPNAEDVWFVLQLFE